MRRLDWLVLLGAWAALALPSLPALAHDAAFPIAGDTILVKADDGRENRKFKFKISGDPLLRVAGHDPRPDGASLVVNGTGDHPRSTGRINLDANLWQEMMNDQDEVVGYKYLDPDATRGGIKKIIFKDGKLVIKAKGAAWNFRPQGDHDAVWVHFVVEKEEFCSQFNVLEGADVLINDNGYYQAVHANAPGTCPEQICGNGEIELGEECDDGNRENDDGCSRSCKITECVAQTFDSTYDAIQSVIFDSPVYGCTDGPCHDSVDPAGDLDLTAGSSYDNLLGVPSFVNPNIVRVRFNEPDDSLLYQKLLAKFKGELPYVGDIPAGSPMPTAAPALTESHLQGVYEWNRNAAPRDQVVANTQALLGACLPPPDPLKIPQPEAPEAQAGIQLTPGPWPLSANSEGEICMSAYFDLRGVVPASARFPCPEEYAQRKFCIRDPSQSCESDEDCPRANDFCYQRSALNETDECFAIHRLALLQDPQSHHSVQFMYAGAQGVHDEGWGEWTYKYDDTSHPDHGQPCEPTEIDPAVGYNPHCSGEPKEAIACIGYGPWDFSNVFAIFGIDANAVNVNVSQEPIHDFTYADGVYEVLPIQGVMAWNSHAFNLTDKDTTLDAYMNLYYAEPEDQLFQLSGLFDAGSIFIQDVPAFEKREYCRTWTADRGTRLTRLTSHTHRLGTLFRVWGPPNEPCQPECSSGNTLCFGDPDVPFCEGPREDEPFYVSTIYNDPQQLLYDPPVEHDSLDPNDRTYYYCAVYDNGSAPSSPVVKRRSTTPPSPFGALTGRCFDL
ncbi:MAG: DUF4215 domain-containing protein, partial [Proteobacteria bacterium]|nr:DUF4215 domain-containing protein [Pseudomonadota bacterium]